MEWLYLILALIMPTLFAAFGFGLAGRGLRSGYIDSLRGWPVAYRASRPILFWFYFVVLLGMGLTGVVVLIWCAKIAVQGWLDG